MTINDFVNTNHKWLLEVATNITATDTNANEIRYDLLSFVTIIIIESGKYSELDNDDYKWLFAKFMKDNYRWKKGGAFWLQAGNISDNSYYELKASLKTSQSDDDYIDILSDCKENCDEDLDLIKFYGDLNKEKIRHVREFESKLPQHLKNLYDMYINQNLSIQKIADKINITRMSAYNMVSELKKQILNSWNQKQSSTSLELPVQDISQPKQTYQTKSKERLSNIYLSGTSLE